MYIYEYIYRAIHNEYIFYGLFFQTLTFLIVQDSFHIYIYRINM